MVRNDVRIIKKKNIIVLSKENGSSDEQLKSCLSQLSKNLKRLKVNKDNVLKQHIFLKEDNREQFLMKKEMYNNILDTYYGKNIPPTSIIAQAPADKIETAMEITIAEDNDYEITDHKIFEDLKYKSVSNGDYKEIFACGLSADNRKKGIYEQADSAFNKMKKILQNEDLDFSSVLRQWNYIENILGIVNDNEKTKQNYQIFNDVRSEYYKGAVFNNGYPAATGIGMSAGGVVIDFIASSENRNIFINPINNPRQVDAYQYSKDVLIGELDKKTTPKFERAKSISDRQFGEIYISGTAAITGEATIKKIDINSQVSTTIENIKELLTIKNLKENGVPISDQQVNITSLRVYVKNREDYYKAADICEQFFPQIPTLYLIADICRDNLLVEIEGKSNF